MKVELRQPAGEHERFAPHSWDGQIGKRVPFKVAGVQIGTATLLAAMVSEDGSEVLLTLDIPVTAGDSPSGFGFHFEEPGAE